MSFLKQKMKLLQKGLDNRRIWLVIPVGATVGNNKTDLVAFNLFIDLKKFREYCYA